jgi:hypothetical protein
VTGHLQPPNLNKSVAFTTSYISRRQLPYSSSCFAIYK